MKTQSIFGVLIINYSFSSWYLNIGPCSEGEENRGKVFNVNAS